MSSRKWHFSTRKHKLFCKGMISKNHGFLRIILCTKSFQKSLPIATQISCQLASGNVPKMWAFLRRFPQAEIIQEIRHILELSNYMVSQIKAERASDFLTSDLLPYLEQLGGGKWVKSSLWLTRNLGCSLLVPYLYRIAIIWMRSSFHYKHR